MRLSSKAIASFCLVLIVCSVLAVALHHHSTSSESAKCSVCVAAHSASPTLDSYEQDDGYIPIATLKQETVAAKQSVIAFALLVRPPPDR
jgi:hypothetical protein